MPQRIPRACRKHGCAKTTTDRSGYCADHINEGWQQHQNGQSRHQRGYGSEWDVRRARILKRDKHLCQQCMRIGRASAAKTVDHIKAKAHGLPMTIRTLKPSAGLVTRAKPRAKGSSDNHSHKINCNCNYFYVIDNYYH